MEITVLNDIQQVDYAIWPWLIYVAAGAIGGLIGSATIIAIWDWITADPVIGKSIAILGMQESGKTQLYATMKGVSYSQYIATGYEDYESFKFQLKGRVIEVKKGTDIGGGIEFVKGNYSRMIKENDIIFFVFDVQKFISDTQYNQDTCDRMDFVYQNLKLNGKAESSHFAVFGSHIDKCSISATDAAKKVREQLQYKSYGDLAQKNFITIDLTNKDDVFKFLDMIIK